MKHVKIFEDFVNGPGPAQDINKPGSAATKGEIDNYMFFANLKNIITMAEEILSMDKESIDEMLTNEHDWANDHISAAKEDIEHVHDWLSSHCESLKTKKS